MADEGAVEEKKPDEQVERSERFQLFIKEYGELVAKHKVDFATYPVFSPDGSGGFKVIIQNTPVDMTNQPTKSPVQQDNFVSESK